MPMIMLMKDDYNSSTAQNGLRRPTGESGKESEKDFFSHLFSGTINNSANAKTQKGLAASWKFSPLNMQDHSVCTSPSGGLH